MPGMINGGAVIPPPIEEEAMGMAPPMGDHPPYHSNGLEQSVSVEKLYQDFVSKNPHADPQAAFMAGVDVGISQGEGMGLPSGAEEFVPPTGANEFGEDVAPIPGMGTETEWGGRTETPYDNSTMGEGFSVYGPQPTGQPTGMMGTPGQMMDTPGQQKKRPRGQPIDMSDFGI